MFCINEKNGQFFTTDKQGREIFRGKNKNVIIALTAGRREPSLACWIPGIRLGHGGIFFNGETWFPEKSNQ